MSRSAFERIQDEVQGLRSIECLNKKCYGDNLLSGNVLNELRSSVNSLTDHEILSLYAIMLRDSKGTVFMLLKA